MTNQFLKGWGVGMMLLFTGMLAAQQSPPPAPSKQSMESKGKMESVNDVVVMKTSLGTIAIELFREKAPVTVKNFLSYVEEKFFDSTVFHRVIKGFMIQGGGFADGDPIAQKKPKPPIKNESDNGMSNDRGTIAMARTPDPNSATSQFFINVADNKSLDRSPRDAGYAVFGKVIEGMDVVDKIRNVATGNAPALALSGNIAAQTSFPDVPLKKVVIESVRRRHPKK